MTAKERIKDWESLSEPEPEPKPKPECCEHCGDESKCNELRSKLCYICFEDQYSDGARW